MHGSRETEQAVGRHMEILLVEDSLAQAQITIAALAAGSVKHRLTLVRDGDEALEFLRLEGRFAQAPRPDLVLLDLRLPGRDGTEVLAELRNIPELSRTPVVVMTASDDEADRRQCEEHGAQAFITKPVNLEKFLSLVEDLRKYWRDDVILPV